MRQWNSSWEISAKTLERIAALRVDLSLDIYGTREEEYDESLFTVVPEDPED